MNRGALLRCEVIIVRAPAGRALAVQVDVMNQPAGARGVVGLQVAVGAVELMRCDASQNDPRALSPPPPHSACV